MKTSGRLFCSVALVVIIGMALAGCATQVNIRTDADLSSILAGGTLRLRSSGRDIVWAVSSTSNGSGPVAAGTFITQNGILTAGADETASFLYVIATSMKDNKYDIKQIRVVTVSEVTVSPVNQHVVIGRTFQFRAQVEGTNNPDRAVTWRVSTNAAGSGAVTSGTRIDSNGLLTVAPNESATTLFVIATSVIDPSKSGNVPATVVVPTVSAVAVSPVNQTVTSGSTSQFNATVTGDYEPSTAVIWHVSSNATGSGAVTPGTDINANGLLRVASTETLTTLFVIATSVADTTKSASIPVTIIVRTVSAVSINPSGQTITTGNNIQFYSSVTGTNNPDTNVTWKVSSNAAGTGAVAPGTSISADGLLKVAPNEWATTLYVIATSVADPSKSASAKVTITNNNEKQGSNQGKVN